MMSFNKLLIGFIALLLLSFSCYGVDLSGRSKMDLLRDKTSKPSEILDLVGIKPGDKVLDLLAGSGYYSEVLSRAVGEKGQVVLHNNKFYRSVLGEAMEQRLSGDRLKNVTKLISETNDLKLKDGDFDAVFLILAYHDMHAMMKGDKRGVDIVFPQIYKALKPGGKLLIIDHNTAPGRGLKDTSEVHRIEDAYALKDISARGFKLLKSSDILQNKNDKFDENVFSSKVRRKTDRFVFVFEKE